MTKTLITSALLYVNGIPHLGHLAGCLLPSDVFARYRRLKGDEVLFPYATDEHGTPSELGASKEKMTPLEYTTKYHELHKEIYKAWGISFDHIGRTSSATNAELTQQLAREINAAGYMEVRETEQMYSKADKRFLPDRYVEGTCPYCKYERARGDQCEACTKLLDPQMLLNPRSAISGSTDLEMRKTKHLYFLLSKMAPALRKWIEGHKKDWSALELGIAYKWLDEGLSDRAITRDLSWGVKVPGDIWPELAGKVFYVWFDAPVGYISATKEYCDESKQDWRGWWFAKGVKYFEFMGKDNLPFHSIFFPAMLMASGKDYHLVDSLKGMSYLNFEGGKFSKSARRGIFMDDAMREFPETDYLRYSVMKNLPEATDADFSFARLADDVNKDINDVLGNFVLRVMKFYKSKWGEEILHEPTPAIDLTQKIAAYEENLNALEFKKALSELRSIWALGNEFLDRAAPWSLYKTDPDTAGGLLVFAMNLARVYATLANPVMPVLSRKILDALNAPLKWDFNLDEINKGHKIIVPDTLFSKITPERVEELDAKYSGKN